MTPERTCPLCDDEDQLGLGLCLPCAAARPVTSPRYLFVRPKAIWEERQEVHRILGNRIPPSEAELVARGHRALLVVPAEVAQRLSQRLGDAGLPVIVAGARTAWAPLPRPLLALMAMMLVAGLAAGVTTPLMASATFPLVALVYIASRIHLLKPAFPAAASSPFDTALQRLIATTLVSGQAGRAHSLLSAIIRQARNLAVGYADAGQREVVADLEVILDRACKVAGRLSALDEAIAARDAGSAGSTSVADLGQARDRLAVALIETLEVLERWHAKGAQLDLVQLTDSVLEAPAA